MDERHFSVNKLPQTSGICIWHYILYILFPCLLNVREPWVNSTEISCNTLSTPFASILISIELIRTNMFILRAFSGNLLLGWLSWIVFGRNALGNALWNVLGSVLGNVHGNVLVGAYSRTFLWTFYRTYWGTFSGTYSGTFRKAVGSSVNVMFEFCRIWRSIFTIKSVSIAFVKAFNEWFAYLFLEFLIVFSL